MMIFKDKSTKTDVENILLRESRCASFTCDGDERVSLANPAEIFEGVSIFFKVEETCGVLNISNEAAIKLANSLITAAFQNQEKTTEARLETEYVEYCQRNGYNQ